MMTFKTIFLLSFFVCLIALPISAIRLLSLSSKPDISDEHTTKVKKHKKITLGFGVATIAFFVLTVLTTESLWCKHQWEVKGTVESTYEKEGYVDKMCKLCSEESRDYLPKLVKENIPSTVKSTKVVVAGDRTAEKESKTSSESEKTTYKQLMKFGFTEKEAKTIENHFNTIGATSINNVRIVTGTNIDDLCAFQCNIFDYKTITLNFTIENRTLCHAEVAGLPTTKIDYFYINIFGNVKTKYKSGIASVDLYDVWDENGEIIPGAVGYKAVFDYNKSEIRPYKK